MVFWGKKDVDNQIEQIEQELSGIQRNKMNNLKTIKLQTTAANSSETSTANGLITIVKVFDKTKFTGTNLNNLAEVRYQRYNTNYNNQYLVNFAWYRINSSSSDTVSGGSDKVYCVFTFVGNYGSAGQTEFEAFLNEANRNMLYFDFIVPNE